MQKDPGEVKQEETKQEATTETQAGVAEAPQEEVAGAGSLVD